MIPVPRKAFPALLGVAIAASAMLTGCSTDPTKGYSFQSTFDADTRTIAVPIFDNSTMSRGLEVDLTEAIIKQIQRRTPWKLTDADRADTTLTGAITTTRLSVLSDSPQTGLVQEQVVQITIRFDFRDNRTGDTIVARDGFAASATFIPQRGVAERLEHGQRSAIDELAHDLVSELRAGW